MILGLELGGDDYVTKPFSPARAGGARQGGAAPHGSAAAGAADGAEPLRRGPLDMDVTRHRCTWDGRELVLTVTEFELLRGLLGSPGRVYSRAELVERLAGISTSPSAPSTRTSGAAQEARDAGADPIETVYGVGYRLRE